MTFFPSVDDLSLSIYLSYYSPLFSSSLFSLSPLLPLFSLSSSPLSLRLVLSHTLRITALAGKLLEPKNISFFLGRRWKTLVERTPREAVMEERERESTVMEEQLVPPRLLRCRRREPEEEIGGDGRSTAEEIRGDGRSTAEEIGGDENKYFIFFIR